MRKYGTPKKLHSFFSHSNAYKIIFIIIIVITIINIVIIIVMNTNVDF